MKLLSAIKGIQVTEKGTRMAAQNKYLFEVDRSANKIEIKRAVEDFFKVKVLKVHTMNYEGKLRRERSFKYGRRNDWKRAIVTLRSGDKIELE